MVFFSACNVDYWSGLSADVLASDYERSSTASLKDSCSVSTPDENINAEDATSYIMERGTELAQSELEVDQNLVNGNSSIEFFSEGNLSSCPVKDEDALEGESEDVELGNFLFEDAPAGDVFPDEVVDLQKKERLRELYSEKTFEKLEGIWTKVICNVRLFLSWTSKFLADFCSNSCKYFFGTDD